MERKVNATPGKPILPAAGTPAYVAVNKPVASHGPASAVLESPVRIAGLFGHNPHQNLILAALPFADYERLAPHLELASMPLGMAVSDPDSAGPYVYFPTSSVVTLLQDTREGATAETALIGSEGMAGLDHCFSGVSPAGRALVKSPGFGFRLPASLFKEEFDRGGAMQNYVLRFFQALLAQVSQTALCNRHHCVIQQVSRWLLACADRLESAHLCMTQEMIANMLGVRRESIAEAAGRLQDESLIHYSRGRITLLDRSRLEQRACECYGNVKQTYERLLPTRIEHAAAKDSVAKDAAAKDAAA